MKKKETKKQKERRIIVETDELIGHVSSGNLLTLLDKVGWILNHYPSSRDSDITCLIKFWETFEPEIINSGMIKVSDLYNHTRLTSVVRARAKIQNEFKLFLASEEVRQRRGTLEEDTQTWAIEEKPDCEEYSLFIDESGKNDKNIILGSLWILDAKANMRLFLEIDKLKKEESYNQEFHFANINSARENVYIRLIDLIYNYSSALSIKYCYLEKEGIAFNEAIKDMLYFLIIDGIKHECKTGRAPLPRAIQVIKDLENKGTDAILLKSVKDRLELANKNMFDGELYFNEFRAIDSQESFNLQISDIIVASINRKLNGRSETLNSKDRVSDYFLKKFSINVNDGKISSYGDLSAKFEI